MNIKFKIIKCIRNRNSLYFVAFFLTLHTVIHTNTLLVKSLGSIKYFSKIHTIILDNTRQINTNFLLGRGKDAGRK